MAEVSVESVAAVLREAAGDDDDVQLDEASFQEPLTDLGFDSLAILEVTALVKREFGVAISDDEMETVRTPADLLARIRAAGVPAQVR